MAIRVLLLALWLLLPPAHAGGAISPAEQQVFSDAHLANLGAAATLHYGYRKTEAGKAAVDDEAVLTARSEGEGGRTVRVDYLHGERHLELPDVEGATGNPLILHFLEADVRAMHRRLGGQENYFRRRIRLALADNARVEPVSIVWAGKAVAASRVTIRPYADDPLKERFRGLDGKSYQFTLSDQVPGGVYDLRTRVDDPAAAGAALEEETLTLRGN